MIEGDAGVIEGDTGVTEGDAGVTKGAGEYSVGYPTAARAALGRPMNCVVLTTTIRVSAVACLHDDVCFGGGRRHHTRK